MADTIETWLATLRATRIVTTLDAANENLLTFSVGEVDRASLEPAVVAAFLVSAGAEWSAQLHGMVSQPWLFYAWHDAQAGQLRLSACPGVGLADLPFGCALRSASAMEVAREFLAGSSVIAWTELADVDETVEGADSSAEFVLAVYSVPLGRH